MTTAQNSFLDDDDDDRESAVSSVSAKSDNPPAQNDTDVCDVTGPTITAKKRGRPKQRRSQSVDKTTQMKRKSRKQNSNQREQLLPFNKQMAQKMTPGELIDQITRQFRRHESKNDDWATQYSQVLQAKINILESKIHTFQTSQHVEEDFESLKRQKDDELLKIQEDHIKELTDKQKKFDDLVQILKQQEETINELKEKDENSQVLLHQHQSTIHSMKSKLAHLSSLNEHLNCQTPSDDTTTTDQTPSTKQATLGEILNMTILQLASKIFHRLGKFSQHFSKDTAKAEIQSLLIYFETYTNKVSDLQTKKETTQDQLQNLQDQYKELQIQFTNMMNEHHTQVQKHQHKDNLIENLRSEQTLKENIQSIRDSLTKEIQSLRDTPNLPTIVPPALNTISQPTFADVVHFPPNAPDKPKLRLQPKSSVKIRYGEVKQNLLTLNKDSTQPVELIRTRQGNLLLACQDPKHLQEITQKLEDIPFVTQNIEVTKLGPRKKRILVFGAPAVKHIQQSLKDDKSETSEEAQDYLENQILPGFKRLLRTDTPDIQWIKTLPSKRDKNSCNLILQLNENDAIRILGQKVYVGLTRCQIREYLQVQRCFKCQCLGHLQSTCKSDTRCGYCAGHHETRTCKKEKDPACINCMQDKSIIGNPAMRQKTHHPSFDTNCPTYRSAFIAVLKSSQNFPPVFSKH